MKVCDHLLEEESHRCERDLLLASGEGRCVQPGGEGRAHVLVWQRGLGADGVLVPGGPVPDAGVGGAGLYDLL